MRGNFAIHGMQTAGKQHQDNEALLVIIVVIGAGGRRAPPSYLWNVIPDVAKDFCAKREDV